MPGFDQDRFINLSVREAKHFECSICLNIFNNAVITECGHSFCRGCLSDVIAKGNKCCPQCKAHFTRKRSKTENLVIIAGYVFISDFKTNLYISQLTVKCDFQSNGCQEGIEMGLLSAHIKDCKYNLCSTCGLKNGKPEEHNCIEMLKQDNSLLKCEISEFKRDRDELKGKCQEWERKHEAACKHILNPPRIVDLELEMKCDDLTEKIKQDLFRYNELKGQNIKLRDEIQRWKWQFYEKNEANTKLSDEIKQVQLNLAGLKEQNSKLSAQKSELLIKCKDFSDNAAQIDQEWRDKFTALTKSKESDQKCQDATLEKSRQCEKRLNDKICELQEKLFKYDKGARHSFVASSICIGTYKCIPSAFELNSTSIEVLRTPSLWPRNGEKHVVIPFEDMQEFFYCTDPTHPAIMIMPTYRFCERLKKHLNLFSNEERIFDINSRDFKRRYMFLVFDENMTESHYRTFVTFLDEKSAEFKHRVKCQALNLREYEKKVQATY